MLQNQRPGVYSRYETASAYATPRAALAAAVVAKAAGGESGRLHVLTSPAQAAQVFPPDTDGATMRGCIGVLFAAGVGRILAVAVGEDGYAPALAEVEQEDGIGAVVCDCTAEADRAALKQSVQASAGALRERLAFCGADPDSAAQAALSLNCGRVVLCCPPVTPAGGGQSHSVYGAAALAGRILAQNDCTWNYSGEALPTVEGPARLPEAQVQALLAAGVSVLEPVGGAVECVRALTTRTQTAGETDYALRGLNTVLCIDNVMQDLRAQLKASLRGLRLSSGSLQAVQSQVVVVLAGKRDSGVLEAFAVPKVYSDPADPAVCVVELAFHIAQVISQIFVTAHIRV